MEGTIYIRCRECDKALIESIAPEAAAEYKQLIVTQVKRFKGMNADDLPCNIIVDGTYLENKDDNEVSGIIGGFKMFAKKGRIVCS